MNNSTKSSLTYLAGTIALSLGIGAAGGWLFGSAVSYVASIFRPGIKEADLTVLFFMAFSVPLLVGAAIAISESIRIGRIVRNLGATGANDHAVEGVLSPNKPSSDMRGIEDSTK